MKITLVGPGTLPIPPDGWGAIETVIWELSQALAEAGHDITILNRSGVLAALRARPWQADIVHVHFDAHLPMWRKLARVLPFRLIATTHSPRAAGEWSDQDERSFSVLLQCSRHLALSEQIADNLRRRNPRIQVVVVPNGVAVNTFTIRSSGNGRAICLGRWEQRKQQAELCEFLSGVPEVPCDFVGPGLEAAVTLPASHLRHLGEWTRDQVRERLTEYSVLLVPSAAEAHSLVTIEAAAAGVPVVVTPEAAANLPGDAPWCRVVALDDQFVEAAKGFIHSGQGVRTAARAYAERHFSWDAVAARYVRALVDLEQ
jgi:glycosyltransferase involved in cell wall biosynthesis